MLDFPYPNVLRASSPVESAFIRHLKPGTVWSVWEIMKGLYITGLIDIGDEAQCVRDLYFDAENYTKDSDGDAELTSVFAARLRSLLKRMSEACRHFGAAEMADFIEDHAVKPGMLPTKVDVFDTLYLGFWSGVNNKSVLVLDRKELDYYQCGSWPFGKEVSAVFKNVDDELKEASQCLAFGLPTACVFHLMRVMERAVRQMATHLGATFPDDADWGTVLSKIDGKIDVMPKGQDRTRWSEARKNLWHVKEAVRNEVMHPRKEGYTPIQAEENYAAVKTFMTHMALLVKPLIPPPPPPPSGSKPVPKRDD